MKGWLHCLLRAELLKLEGLGDLRAVLKGEGPLQWDTSWLCIPGTHFPHWAFILLFAYVDTDLLLLCSAVNPF